MTTKHVFLSYIREDSAQVDKLQRVLEAADFSVWRDTANLWPGDDWQQKIRQAIQGGTLVFLACFSSALKARDTSYQFAELMLAADEYRLRPLDTSWLMTIRFDECEIPSVDLGGGRFLDRTIHRLDLFGEHESAQQARLITALHRVMQTSPGSPSGNVLAAVAASKRADTSLDHLRDLIRNPNLVMNYDAYLSSLRRPALRDLADRERFPISGPSGQIDAEIAKAWLARILDYEDIVVDLLEPLKLIGEYGQTQHHDELTRTMRAFAQECTQSAGLDLFRSAHQYPALLLSYVLGLAAVSKSNYGMLRAGVADVVVRTLNSQAPFILMSGAGRIPGNWNWLGSLLCKRDENIPVDDGLIGSLASGRIGARYTPISDHLYTLLAPLFADQFVSDEDYADAYDRVEILLDAIAADAKQQSGSYVSARGGYGRYTWRHEHAEIPPERRMLDEAQAAGAGWTPLLGGLFGGDTNRAVAALTVVVENARSLSFGRH
ncbi:toll/interleukin-1 receptor domain-containing protein [Microbacterium sp. B19]|uniref:toll/interleukin-1 receptor domain-containing protein n=1 Tax=Microbacterium sp. B19 TaxID=96765 RepID=UPI0003B5D66E|nr:toll/interleukin-1 receptor domain-containing protein [Microbacterium sp. B19]